MPPRGRPTNASRGAIARATTRVASPAPKKPSSRGPPSKDAQPKPDGAKEEFGWGPLGLWARYQHCWCSYPLRTKFLTAAGMGLLGNLICQIIVEGEVFSSLFGSVLLWFGLSSPPEVDFKRLGLFTLVFALAFGLIPPVWYKYLNRMVPERRAMGGFLRLLPDQFLFQPLLHVLVVFLYKSAMALELTPPTDEDVWNIQTIGWAVWIPASIISFFLPTSLQLLCYDLVLLGWSAFLSSALK